VHLLDIAAPVGIGGIWIWYFLHNLKAQSVLPERDPRMEGALEPAAGH
jgi:hypothetical protein